MVRVRVRGRKGQGFGLGVEGLASTEQDEEYHAYRPHVHSGAQPLAVAALAGLARVRVWVRARGRVMGEGQWQVMGEGQGAAERSS